MAINKAMQAALRAVSYREGSVAEYYPLERELKTLAGRRPLRPAYTVWDHKVKVGDHCVPVRLYHPPKGRIIPGLLVFFHGGGWVTGNIDSYDRVCDNMTRATGRLVLSVDYRLAPEHRFPAGLEDCYAVTRELFCGAGMAGIRPEDITLIGDSAGGNLAAAVSLMARDRQEFLPRRQILLYPATAADHGPDAPFQSVQTNGTDYLLTAKRVEEYMQLYQKSPADRENPYFAPLLEQNLENQPDTLLITAEYDPLRDEGEAYGEALRAAGNRVQIVRMTNALHGFISLPPRFVHVKKAYLRINDFLERGGAL